jgi:glycosyltransferase involved in cell wall biosynthesis
VVLSKIEMARLLHLIDEFKMGGAQTHLITMLREAQKTYPHIDHEVVSLFGSGPIGKQIKEMSIKVKVFNFRYLFQDKRFLKAAAELENYIKSVEPDLVEAHLTWSRLLGLYAAWKAGVSKRIGFEQGDIYMNSLPLRLLNFGGQFVADDIIVCSHALKEWVHNTHRVFNKKLTVLHNCVDVKKFCTDGAAHANGIRDSVDTEFIFVP